MKWLWKSVKFVLALGIAGALAGSLALAFSYYYLEPDLPEIDNLRDVRLQVPLKVYSADGGLIAEFGEKRRIPLSHDEFPPRMVQAFLSAEDANYFSHPGVDYRGLLRAAIQLALTGEKRQGGSTITMQVARNFYLSRQKTYTRKLSEIFLALKIERELSKEEILELYLNKIYLGHRAYGVGAAARVYYGKLVAELDLAQTAMIAGLPKAPSTLNPLTNPTRAVERRNYVLERMLELGYISRDEYQAAATAPVSAGRHAPPVEVEAPYVAEMVRNEMVDRFGEEAYTGGYSVYTTIVASQQGAANQAVRDALDAYSERHGYHGPEGRLASLPEEQEALDAALADRPRVGRLRPAIVIGVDEQAAEIYLGDGEHATVAFEQMTWAQPHIDADRRGPAPKKPADVVQPGDVIRVKRVSVDDQDAWRLAQIPRAASALVALDPQDGAIRALVGGYDFFHSKFNRAVQAKRQPGSGFKAFIYSAALENGFTPASLINDAPVVFDDPSLEGDWRPENYSRKFFGPTRLREALAKSRNLVSIRLLRSMGVDAAIEHIARFGFDPAQMPRNLSLALGSGEVTPLEMARGYAVLANGGFLVEPFYVVRIEQDGAGIVFEAAPARACPECPDDSETVEGRAPRTLDSGNRFLMYSMMQDVIRAGTATRARELGRSDLAGKTGTTNDQRDAWFNGFNEHLVAATWIGFDDNQKLGRGEVGGRAALPAWIDFMRVALDGLPQREPVMPEGIVTVRIDPRTGQRASAATADAMFEVFREEMAPGSESGVAAAVDGSTAPVTPVITPPVARDLF